MVISWQSATHMCFLAFSHTSTNTTFFSKPPATFLICFSRGERQAYTGKKVFLNQISNSKPPGHESNTLTTESPEWGSTAKWLVPDLLKNRTEPLQSKVLSQWLNDWLNGVLRRFYFSHITATAHIIHAFLGFTSTGLGSEVSCPRTLPWKNPEDLVWLEPKIPGLRVNNLTTEPRETLSRKSNIASSVFSSG